MLYNWFVPLRRLAMELMKKANGTVETGYAAIKKEAAFA